MADLENTSSGVPPSTEPQKPEDGLQTIRTYRGDVMGAVKHKGETISSIVLAEQKRRILGGQNTQIDEAPGSRVNWNYIIIGASAVLVLLGIGVALTLWLTKEEAPAVPPALVLPQEAIFSDRGKELSLSRFTRQEIFGLATLEIQEANVPTNQTQTVVFSKQVQGTTPEGTPVMLKERVGFKEIITATGASAPQTLLRSIDDSFIYGVYSFRGNNPFLILTANTYESAFSGMLQWEKTMLFDLTPLMGSLEGSGNFKDVVLKNRDVRETANGEGKVVLLYSFLDKKTLLITTDETTFEELLRRFLTPREVLR